MQKSDDPWVTQELINYLEFLYPDSSPSLDDDDRKIWWKAGQASVVRHLKLILEEQNESAYDLFRAPE